MTNVSQSHETLVHTTADDDVPLEGVVIAPKVAANPVAVVWIHGGAAKFYERHYVMLAREMATRGFPVLLGNTRGHDAFTLLWRESEDRDIVLGGGSFERFEHSPADIRSWIAMAMTLGVNGVVLAGHSLGASKAVYYQSVTDDPRVLGLAAVSPVAGWYSDPQRVALAIGMVAEGRGEELLPRQPESPPWNLVSAQTVASREEVIRHVFDSDTRRPLISDINRPVLVLYGGEEDMPREWLDTLRRNTRSLPNFDLVTVARAGHEYSGHEATLASELSEWITKVCLGCD